MPDGAWLGRALEAFLPGFSAADPTAALRELAKHETDADAARALEIVSALRAVQAGDTDGARGVLRDIAAAQRDDLIVATFLAELELAAGDPTAAAIVVEQTATATTDPLAAAALWIQAGLLRWRVGDKPAALDAFSSAAEKLPASEDGRPTVAQSLLGWASRGVDPDTIESRRRAIARAKDAGGDERVLGIERFVTEIVGGDGGAAAEALATVEGSARRRPRGRRGARASALGGRHGRSRSVRRRDGSPPRGGLRGARGFGALSRGTRRAIPRRRRSRRANGSTSAAARRPRSSGSSARRRRATSRTKRTRATRSRVRSAAKRAKRSERGAACSAASTATRPLVSGTTDASRLAALELAPPGSDPRRRAAALCTIGEIARRRDALAVDGRRRVVAPRDGRRRGRAQRVRGGRAGQPGRSRGVGRHAHRGRGAGGDARLKRARREELGARCGDAARGAAFWEEAAHVWLALGQEDARRDRVRRRASRAIRDAPARSTSCSAACASARTAIAARSSSRCASTVTDDPPEIAKLYWEQARVLREKGDPDGALKALENVTMIEPDHVGALALTGEIFLTRQMFAEAADGSRASPPSTRRRRRTASPPASRRSTSTRTSSTRRSARSRSSSCSTRRGSRRCPCASASRRQRRAPARGTRPTTILEELMNERAERDGRIEAARLAMAIYRDQIGDKPRARSGGDEAPRGVARRRRSARHAPRDRGARTSARCSSARATHALVGAPEDVRTIIDAARQARANRARARRRAARRRCRRRSPSRSAAAIAAVEGALARARARPRARCRRGALGRAPSRALRAARRRSGRGALRDLAPARRPRRSDPRSPRSASASAIASTRERASQTAQRDRRVGGRVRHIASSISTSAATTRSACKASPARYPRSSSGRT